MDRKTARRVIKASVWQNLQGNWLKSFLMLIIQIFILSTVLSFSPIRIPSAEELVVAVDTGAPILALFFPKGITTRVIASIAVTLVLYFIVSCPLTIGINKFFLSVARGEKAKISCIFAPFASLKTVFSSIWLNVLIMFISAFWSFLFALIPVSLMVIATLFNSFIVAQIALASMYAAVVFAVLWVSRYSFATYIFAEGEFGPFNSLRECIRLVNYHSGECMILRASYFGWDLLASAIVPLTFVYRTLFGTVYAKYLYYLRGELSIGETEFPPNI